HRNKLKRDQLAKSWSTSCGIAESRLALVSHSLPRNPEYAATGPYVASTISMQLMSSSRYHRGRLQGLRSTGRILPGRADLRFHELFGSTRREPRLREVALEHDVVLLVVRSGAAFGNARDLKKVHEFWHILVTGVERRPLDAETFVVVHDRAIRNYGILRIGENDDDIGHRNLLSSYSNGSFTLSGGRFPSSAAASQHLFCAAVDLHGTSVRIPKRFPIRRKT